MWNSALGRSYNFNKLSNIFAIHLRETAGPDRAFPPSGRKLEESKGIQGTRKDINRACPEILLCSHSAPSMEDRGTAGHHMETSKPRGTPIPIPSFTKIGLPTPIIPSFAPQCFPRIPTRSFVLEMVDSSHSIGEPFLLSPL